MCNTINFNANIKLSSIASQNAPLNSKIICVKEREKEENKTEKIKHIRQQTLGTK